MIPKDESQTKKDLIQLHSMLKPGDTVYTCVKHVSNSGMNRVISVYVIHNNEIYDMSWLAARTIGNRFDEKYGGVKMSGYGMDMGFALVYTLGRVMFAANGFGCIGEGCPSNDHFNGDHDYTPHMHSDPGYALRQRWL